MNSTITTSYGDVPLETLIRSFEREKLANEKKAEKRLQYLQTDEGKEWNRSRAKAYYEKNKETIAEKRKEYYQQKKEIIKQKRLQRTTESS